MRQPIYIEKIAFTWLIVASLLSQGCSSLSKTHDSAHSTIIKDVTDELSDAEREGISSAIVLVEDSNKVVTLKGFNAEGKIKGTVTGAVVGVPVTVLALATTGVGIYIIYFFPEYVVAGGAVIGAVYGGAVTESKEKMQQAEYTALKSLDELSLEDLLLEHIEPFADGSNRLETTGLEGSSLPVSFDAPAYGAFQSILIISITEAGTQNPRVDTSLFSTDIVDVRIAAHVQLIRTRDGSTLYEATYLYCSPPSKRKKFQEWTAGNGQMFRAEILCGIAEIAACILSDVFKNLETPGLPHEAVTKNRINAYG